LRIWPADDPQAKGKTKAIYNPLAAPKPKQTRLAPEPAESSSTPSSPVGPLLLDDSIDPTTMAPTTLVLALRKKRRDAKRLHRSEARRSTMRASTLRTEAEITEREQQDKEHPNRKGRRAQHETGKVRVVRKMTQDELIAAALEEEERNKEDLRMWVRKEEEKRELRRVGRKRVRGPRWTWISRTVGKTFEVLGDDEVEKQRTILNAELPESTLSTEARQGGPDKRDGTFGEAATHIAVPAPTIDGPQLTSTSPGLQSVTAGLPISATPNLGIPQDKPSLPSTRGDEAVIPIPTAEGPVARPSTPSAHLPVPTSAVANSSTQQITSTSPQSAPSLNAPPPNSTPEPTSSQYARNYLILSQIQGGLSAELGIVLGDHVKWDEVQFIPARNRPISQSFTPPHMSPLISLDRRPVLCPFTGLPAKYRHPSTMIPYATIEGHREIEALIANRYVWSQGGGCWLGGEEDVGAEGVEEVVCWREAVNGGWIGESQVGEVGRKLAGGMASPEDDGARRPGKRRKIGLGSPEVDDVITVQVGKGSAKGKGKSRARS